MYSNVHDDTLKVAVKSGKTPEDALALGTLVAAVNVVDEACSAEDKGKKEDAKRMLVEVDTVEEVAAPDLLEIAAADIMMAKVQQQHGEKKLGDDVSDKIKEAEAKALRLVEANCVLVPIPSSEKRVKELLAASPAGQMRGKDGKTFVGIFVDNGLFGEPVTAPHIRMNAVNQPVLKVFVC